MPVITRNFARAMWQDLYFVLLKHLLDTGVLAEEELEFIEFHGRSVPAYARHGYTDKVVGALTELTGIDPARDGKGEKRRRLKKAGETFPKGDRGGIVYLFYRSLRPMALSPLSPVDVQLQSGIVSFSRYLAEKMLQCIENNQLVHLVPDFNELKECIASSFKSNKVDRLKGVSGAVDENLLRQHKHMWSADRFPKGFIGTVWRVHERTDAGICLSYLSFQLAGKYVEVQMKTSYKAGGRSQKFSYVGIAGTDEGRNYLVIQMFRVDKPHTYLNLILRVDSYNDEIQQAASGQMLYYAIRFRKYVTKIVIAERTRLSPGKMPEPKEVFKTDTKSFEQISKYIRRYLFVRSKNRLPMPEKIIDSIDDVNLTNSLRNWVLKHLSPEETDARLRDIWGDYVLIYFDQKKKKQELPVAILPEDPSLSDFVYPTVMKFRVEELDYIGKVFINPNTILQTTLEPIRPDGDRSTPLIPLRRISIDVAVPVTANLASFSSKMKEGPHYGFVMGLANVNSNMPTAFRCLLASRGLLITKSMLDALVEGGPGI